MKQVTRHVDEIMRRIRNDPYFNEVYEIVQRNTTGKFYLVGGKLYRTAIELVHDCYVGADKADWDFLCMDVDSYAVIPRDWRNKKIPHAANDPDAYPGEYSSKSRRLEKHAPYTLADLSALRKPRGVECKIDMIDVNDAISAGGFKADIYGYMDAVPMNTQAIAYDFENHQIIGDKGLWSIINKTCYINPTFRLAGAHYRSPYEWRKYYDTKSKSLGFEWTNEGHKCYCYPEDPRMIIWNPCKCGGK